MSLFDVKSLFQKKSRLRDMQEKIQAKSDAQQHSLQELNARQTLFAFEEICWDSHQCYYRLAPGTIRPGTKKMLQNMVRSILIEYYGPAASQLQLLLR